MLSAGPRVYRYRRRQARSKLIELIAFVIEKDAHRDPLNDLGEIARGILRRNDAEHRSGRRSDAYDTTVKLMS